MLQINDPRRVPTPAELPLLEKLVNDSEQGQDVIITQLTISDKAQVWRHRSLTEASGLWTWPSHISV